MRLPLRATSTAETSRRENLSRDLLLEQILEGLTILSEFLDTLMQLIKRHLFLEQRPAELGLVVDEGDFGDRFALGGYFQIKNSISHTSSHRIPAR